MVGLSVTTLFREFVPLVPVFDSVESVTQLPSAPCGGACGDGEVVRGAGPLTPDGVRMVDRALIQRYRVLGVAFEVHIPGEQESLPAPPAAIASLVAGTAQSSLTLARAKDTTPRGNGMLIGHVSERTGAPIPGAVVQLLGTASMATTDDTGHFVLDTRALGAFMVGVRRLGFQSERLAVTLAPGRPSVLAVTLARLVPVLPTVMTTAAERSAYREVGFEQRLQAGIGQFLTYDQILQKNAPQFSELLRGMRAITLVHRPQQSGTVLLGTRPGKGAPTCVSLVVDGVPQPLRDEHSAKGTTLIGSQSPDGLIDVSNVGAIQVYEPSERPAGLGEEDFCVLVVVWTRTRLVLPVVSKTLLDTTSVRQAIRGHAQLDSGSACTPPPPADTMDVTLYAVLQAGPSQAAMGRAWAKYRDSILTLIQRWFVFPTELSLPVLSPAFQRRQQTGNGQDEDNQSADAAPILSDVIVFSLDSAGL